MVCREHFEYYRSKLDDDVRTEQQHMAGVYGRSVWQDCMLEQAQLSCRGDCAMPACAEMAI